MMEKKSIIHYIGLTMILSAFFVSCNKKDDQIGLDIQKNEGTIGHSLLQDEINLSLKNIIKDDELYTSGSDLLHVGRYDDMYVGEVKSTSFFQVAMANDLPNFVSQSCDSLFLQLAFNQNNVADRVLQGDGLVNNTLEIHQMNQFFQENQVYKNSETFTYESEVLGSINYNPLQETGYISIRLNKVFGDSIMKWAHLKSINQFKSALAGLALVGNLNDGSIVSFNINSDNSFLKTFYSKNGYTLSYKFDLSTSLRHHVHIVSNREGSSFSAIKTSQLTSSADLNNQLLIQNGVGSSIWVNFGDLKALFANKNNILINKAELYLPIKENTSNAQTELPVARLKAYEADAYGNYLLASDTKQQIVSDFSKVVSTGTGEFVLNQDKNAYKLDITYYIQEYLLGERELNSLLITPNVIVDGINYQSRTNRSIIDASKAVFKIYYSEL